MKKFLLFLTLFLLPFCLSAQGQFIKGGRAAKNAKTFFSGKRFVKISPNVAKSARYAGTAAAAGRAARFSSAAPNFAASVERNAQVAEFLDRTITLKKLQAQISALKYNRTLVPMLADPAEAWGSYGRLKSIARTAKADPRIMAIQPAWYSIWKTKTFNGAHHIMNQYAIKQIWHTSPYAGRVDFGLVIKDAPSMFHQFHGKQAFAYVFHNPEVQVALYMKGGVKAVMENQLMTINTLNIEYGLPQLSEAFMTNTMRHAKTWALDYKLRWK